MHNTLSISLLQQSGPELILIRWMQVDESTTTRWQVVVDDNIDPRSKAPESEMKDSRMIFPTGPFLISGINYHLSHVAAVEWRSLMTTFISPNSSLS